MPLGGGGRRLMANTILNFHFDYLNPSLRALTNSTYRSQQGNFTQTPFSDIRYQISWWCVFLLTRSIRWCVDRFCKDQRCQGQRWQGGWRLFSLARSQLACACTQGQSSHHLQCAALAFGLKTKARRCILTMCMYLRAWNISDEGY